MEYTITPIALDKLIFDPENPRLPETIRRKKHNSDYQSLVIDWMLQSENIIELMGSIGEKGYFPAEPLLVVKQADSDIFEVVEGNRRLTACKLLVDPQLATKRKKTIEEVVSEANPEKLPHEIPCIVFSARTDILAYLGYKHITGIEPWDSLAKAKYLKQLYSTLTDGSFTSKCKTLAKIIGSRADYVRSLLVGLDAYTVIEEADFYNIPNLGEEEFEFGVFYTALNRSNVSKYVGIDLNSENPLENLKPDGLEDLTNWMFATNAEGFTRLGESRNLQKLNKVLDESYPKALQAFKAGKTLDEAARYTDHPAEIFEKNIRDSLYYLQIARDILHEIDTPSDSSLTNVAEIYKVSRDLHKLIKTKIEESGDLDELL